MQRTEISVRCCCWCGSTNLDSAVGYGGERACRVCGWGGNGEPDVPCMFYKLVQLRPAEQP
jgi:hypothetical protein